MYVRVCVLWALKISVPNKYITDYSASQQHSLTFLRWFFLLPVCLDLLDASDDALQAVEVCLSEESRPADARGDLQDTTAEVVQQRLKVLGGT